MSNNENSSNIIFSINYIKEVSFVVRENLLGSDLNKEILVQLIGETGYNLEQNILKFSLKVWYHFRDEEAELAAIEVENLFTVKDLKNFIRSDSKIQFPPIVWAHIIGISLSHTRSLFTKNLAGTALQKVMVPIMNPTEVAKEFFPESFEKEFSEDAIGVEAEYEPETKKRIAKRGGGKPPK